MGELDLPKRTTGRVKKKALSSKTTGQACPKCGTKMIKGQDTCPKCHYSSKTAYKSLREAKEFTHPG
jgi:uncharacterized OB-fold protein